MRRIASLLFKSTLAAAVAIVAIAGSADAQSRKRKKATAPALPKAQQVAIPVDMPVGSIVIVNSERRLYYVTAPGEARRYGVAVGKHDELWMGRTFVSHKQVDPRWVPVDGEDPIEGGDPSNPLGKRALYLDWSLLRIHGTPSRHSIGSAVSNGCIRMLNEDVIDLYERAHLGAPVFAIRSWSDAEAAIATPVAQRTHADPAAHRLAQIRLKERIKAVAERKAAEARGERFARSERRGQVRYANAAGGGSWFAPAPRRDYAGNSRSALGR